MNAARFSLACLVCGALAALPALSQTPPAATTPVAPAPVTGAVTNADLEPAVDTSAGVSSNPAPAATARPTATTPASPSSNSARRPNSAAPAGRTIDRVDLDATQITGNRELPKVLYIVPWKRPDLGDLVGRPLNSLLDEVLAPVDRDVFRRENRYYDALRPDQAGSLPASAPAPKAPETAPGAAPAAPAGELRSGSQPSPPPGQ
jgi:hypothetical protein